MDSNAWSTHRAARELTQSMMKRGQRQAIPSQTGHHANISYQPHPLQARMPVFADDDVVVHRYPERRGDIDDGLGHLDIRT